MPTRKRGGGQGKKSAAYKRSQATRKRAGKYRGKGTSKVGDKIAQCFKFDGGKKRGRGKVGCKPKRQTKLAHNDPSGVETSVIPETNITYTTSSKSKLKDIKEGKKIFSGSSFGRKTKDYLNIESIQKDDPKEDIFKEKYSDYTDIA
jgi:hypothetical protein